MDSGIYQLTFPNGQFYIGKSENIPKRWKTHQVNFEKGTHTKKMQEVYDMYGPPEYQVALEVHSDHIDIYESIYIATAWGSNLLNATKPKPISPEEAKEYLEYYDKLKINGESALLASTLMHLKALEECHLALENTSEELRQLKLKGIRTPDSILDELEYYETSNGEMYHELERLKKLSLWNRIFNYKVYV
jgi:hypothetical protein